ncbi:unnamed protein product [Paramecium pentaurelia]|uniref:RING-type domain-containing protein n=1 Tax=Paramecium pentaurelia TaxID=43138 RepID=A0A8S1XDC3_9CILI|nr:unnamed protein product [Paramecium pentaurelia]
MNNYNKLNSLNLISQDVLFVMKKCYINIIRIISICVNSKQEITIQSNNNANNVVNRLLSFTRTITQRYVQVIFGLKLNVHIVLLQYQKLIQRIILLNGNKGNQELFNMFRGYFRKRADLKCFHSFHQECIENWLKQRQKCPICKRINDKAFISEEQFDIY